MSDTPPNPLEGLLSEFALGPSWARAKSDAPEKKSQFGDEREAPRRHDDRRDDRQGGGRRDNRNDREGRDSRDNRQGGYGDRRQGGAAGGGSRRNFDPSRGRPDPRRDEVAPAEGVEISLLPEKAAIQLICKEIHQVARVYPLFDIAQIILAERSRCRAVVEIQESRPPLYRCKVEEALFLTKEEALRYLLESPWRERYVEESTVEVDPPKGNFQSVARCGISGEWLGPPNFHAYQTNLRRLHRERFANMPFEAYTAKVRTERGEEAVNQWLESMKNQTRWRILSQREIAERTAAQKAKETAVKDSATESPAAPEAESPQAIAESAAEMEAPVEPAPVSEETNASEAPAELLAEVAVLEEVSAESEAPANEAETGAASEEAEPEPEAPTEPEAEIHWITDRAEAERVIAAEVLEKVFQITRKAKVSAAIPAKNLSPGLLAKLKQTGMHFRKHPALLIPVICRVLEAEHMPVFKRKAKLYTGPARPHSLAPDAVLAERPAAMVKWIRENTPAKLEGLWKAVLPEDSLAPPQAFAADLFWLLQQGHILLYTDDTLVVQEPREAPEPKKAKKKGKKQAPAKDSPSQPDTAGDVAAEATATEEPSTEEPSAESQSEEPPKAEADGVPEEVPSVSPNEAPPETPAEAPAYTPEEFPIEQPPELPEADPHPELPPEAPVESPPEMQESAPHAEVPVEASDPVSEPGEEPRQDMPASTDQ